MRYPMSVLIKNGRIITASDDQVADIFIEGETVSAIGKNLNLPADTTIDASGKELFRHEGFFSRDDILSKWKQLGVKID